MVTEILWCCFVLVSWELKRLELRSSRVLKWTELWTCLQLHHCSSWNVTFWWTKCICSYLEPTALSDFQKPPKSNILDDVVELTIFLRFSSHTKLGIIAAEALGRKKHMYETSCEDAWAPNDRRTCIVLSLSPLPSQHVQAPVYFSTSEMFGTDSDFAKRRSAFEISQIFSYVIKITLTIEPLQSRCGIEHAEFPVLTISLTAVRFGDGFFEFNLTLFRFETLGQGGILIQTVQKIFNRGKATFFKINFSAWTCWREKTGLTNVRTSLFPFISCLFHTNKARNLSFWFVMWKLSMLRATRSTLYRRTELVSFLLSVVHPTY